MYIRKIIINNITSLKGEHVIDFTREPLRSADLFAITGDTGAGKSTILDCICLALYNRAPRFALRERNVVAVAADKTAANRLPGYDTRNVLRRGETEGSCAVEFLTQEGMFVATWSVRVKRTGTFDSVTRSLVQVEPKKKNFDPREVQNEILRLVGLDYDQFTRTVILAQNSFANFLRARRDEKSKLLEKITGTEIYNKISSVVYEQSRKADEDYKVKETEYRHYENETLDEVSQKEYRNRKNLVESQLKLLDQKTEYKKKQLAWYDTYEELEEKVSAATEAYSKANRTNVDMTLKREKLQRYDDVAEIRDSVVSLQNTESRIAESQNSRERLVEEENEKKREKAAAYAVLDEAKKEYVKYESSLHQQEPLFKKAHEVLREIDICENTKKEKTGDLEQKQKEAAEIERKISDSRSALKGYETQAENHRNVMQSLLPHQAMLDQYGSVIEKIRTYGTLLSDSETMKKRQKSTNAELETLKNALEKTDGEIDASLQKKESLEKSRTQLQNSILGVDNAMLQESYNKAFVLRTNLLGAKRLWESLSAEYEENEKNESAISSISMTLDTRKAQLRDLEIETTKYRQIYEIHEKYFNMGQTDNVKELRRNLKEGEPCPVCGATHHPYHSESEQRLNEVVSNAERSRDEAREKYNASEEKFNNLKTRQSSDTERYRSLQNKRDEMARRIKKYCEEWQQQYAPLDKTFADCSGKVDASARRLLIMQLLENADKTVGETRKRLEEYAKCRAEIERCTKEIEQVSNVLSELQKKRSDILMNKGVDEGNLATIAENMNSNSDNAHEIYLDLEKLLTVADWRRLIRENPKLLRERISEFYDKWKECGENVKKVEECKNEAENDLKMLEQNLQNVNDTIHELNAKIEELNNMISSNKNGIYKMFGEENPVEVEENVRRQLETARKNVEERTASLHNAEKVLGAVSAQYAQVSEELKRLEEEKLRMSTEIDTWISAFNQEHSSVRFNELVEIFKSDYDWNSMRNELKKVENEYSLACDRMKAAQAELNSWQSRPEHPDRTLETRRSISSDIETMRQKRIVTQKELDDINVKLTLHENGAEKMKEMKPKLDELGKNASEWAKLNGLIGSANGMVFSRVAQNSTLKILVDHANSQLALFSPRYRLNKVEDALDLEITDRYMSDESRPVSSLSGGETFVVSLALALGLSSLSNNRLSIGSLFIDEGFGNLDNESLDMVINALGSLNAQGRKVGIISHTQQIRDNIFPQIQVVHKNAADSSSTIKVVSF